MTADSLQQITTCQISVL